MLFRFAEISDLEGIYQLSSKSGVGLSLPKDKNEIEQLIVRSNTSCTRKVKAPLDEYYLFVLEDPLSKQIAGTAGIEAMTGATKARFSFKVTHEPRLCPRLAIQTTHSYLTLVTENQGYSELCTLYLDPDFRQHQNGLLLSLARFLFIKNETHRFTPSVIAELRGYTNANDESPFWQTIGYPFFKLPYATADKLSLKKEKQVVEQLMPQHPICINLLSPEIQSIIGQPNPLTKPALRILQRQGFKYTDTVDIFDAGPTLKAAVCEVHSITSSQICTISTEKVSEPTKRVLISNHQTHIRATITHAYVDTYQHTCSIPEYVARLLHLQNGDNANIMNL